jgi:hypothetical protein
MNKYGHLHIQNDNTSPPSAGTFDSPLWHIGQRDTGIFDISFGALSTQLVSLADSIIQMQRVGNSATGAKQIGFFGSAPASKVSVSTLGGLSAASTGSPTPPGVGDTAYGDFSSAVSQLNSNINYVQSRLDALISSLNNLGLV